ncbi:hypothetical protein DFH29DRAFT_881724 [Suillus ampliporus]|nr:hypothetical protein DFH29DRAFT_881724 [Suillus ampliporus]
MKQRGRLAATFFFSHKYAQCAAAIIPTIAYQLALAFPLIRSDIVRAIEKDEMLLSSEKSRSDQMLELVIKPLHRLKFRQEMPYTIVIDALDECFSSEEAARLVALWIETLSGPDLPFIQLFLTSRPDAHIRAAMQGSVHEIILTSRDEDTIHDIRFRVFLRTSLDKIRTSRSAIFRQPFIPWPSQDDFEALASKAGVGHHPQQRLDLLLREKLAVGADIDQLYRQIIATSEDPVLHSRILASIIHLHEQLSLAQLQQLFYADAHRFAVTLEEFSPIILNPPDGIGKDPLCSQQYYVRAHAQEHLACCCLDPLMRKESTSGKAYPYAFAAWGDHLSVAYPSRKLRCLLVVFLEEEVWRWMVSPEQHDSVSHLRKSLFRAKEPCLSFKWIKNLSDIAVAWRAVRAWRRANEALKNYHLSSA